MDIFNLEEVYESPTAFVGSFAVWLEKLVPSKSRIMGEKEVLRENETKVSFEIPHGVLRRLGV